MGRAIIKKGLKCYDSVRKGRNHLNVSPNGRITHKNILNKKVNLIKGYKMNNKFKFFEVVKVVSTNSELSEVNGKIGTITGMVEDDELWSYSVSFEDLESSWCLDEIDLVSTHRFAKREDFYTGESIKVLVSPDGKGRLEEE